MVLCSLVVWMLPAYAAEYTNRTIETSNSFYITAHNAPHTRYTTPRQTLKLSPYEDLRPNVLLGYSISINRGISGREWECLYKLVVRESNWRSEALNKTSGAYGIFQFLDSTWAGTGYERTADPAIQIEAGLKYIENRYGTPCEALDHSYDFNWY